MNNNDSNSDSSTTTKDSVTYTHTVLFPASSEQTTVRVESKRGVPKLKGILKKHNTTIRTVSPFHPWCDGVTVDKIDREDVLDTVRKLICATHCERDVVWHIILNTPSGVFKNKGHLYAFHVHH
jgi:hypothetical protein